MPFVTVTQMEGAFSAEPKQAMIEKITRRRGTGHVSDALANLLEQASAGDAPVLAALCREPPRWAR